MLCWFWAPMIYGDEVTSLSAAAPRVQERQESAPRKGEDEIRLPVISLYRGVYDKEYQGQGWQGGAGGQERKIGTELG